MWIYEVINQTINSRTCVRAYAPSPLIDGRHGGLDGCMDDFLRIARLLANAMTLWWCPTTVEAVC